MSKKSRERRAKNKTNCMRPDDYVSNGVFEMARFGANIVMQNNRTPKQQEEHMELLAAQYEAKYNEITHKITALKDKVSKSDPYEILMHLRAKANIAQMNKLSESDYSMDENAIVCAQEYIQSMLVSSENIYDATMDEDIEWEFYEQILADFKELYEEFVFFYHYWAAHVKKEQSIDDKIIDELVMSQSLYLVKGNRYQIFELEPIKYLLPPHDEVLIELFGVSSSDIISGLDKLRYALSQEYADSVMGLFEEFERYQQGNAEDFEKAQNLAEKVYGSALIDVKTITGWDDRFIETLTLEVGENKTFFGEAEFAGWPIVELPVSRKPFIKIDGKVYAFLYYKLFDNIYRNIQKSIMKRKPEYLAEWKDKQCAASESMVKETFATLLPGAEIYVGNHYPQRNSLKQMNENDMIIIYHNYLFIIEVKAGSFPNTPPITDFAAHINAYHTLAEVADSQCSRTLNYISSKNEAPFYNKDKTPKFTLPNIANFKDVFTFSVTVDNFNEFAARMEKLSFISLSCKTFVISYDDLLVYANYFDSPMQFLHYLKQRKAAMDVEKYQIYDEIEHLGIYIDKNLYARNQFGDDFKHINWNGFRAKLDIYFSMLYTCPGKIEKPRQKWNKKFDEIIKFLSENVSAENINLALFLMNLSTDAKNDMEEQIEYVLVRQKQRGYTIPSYVVGDFKYCIFVEMEGISSMSESQQRDYAYALASRNEQVPVMLISLKYDNHNALIKVGSKECDFTKLAAEDADRLKKLGVEKSKGWVEIAKMRKGNIGRNDYCPCGSGKKFKFCCLNNS
ncbi:MAG: SEC-C domain-containing protein [Clostridia bacterium]|nr:SEC-C domain-containing protein [Clostridia bacterium]